MPYKDPEAKKEHNKRYQKEWYQKNKEAHKKTTRKNRKIQVIKMSQFVGDYKSSRGCCRCIENDPACLDFHHENPDEKDIDISKAVSDGYGQKRIQKEIDKCIILCANCHRKLHASERLINE